MSAKDWEEIPSGFVDEIAKNGRASMYEARNMARELKHLRTIHNQPQVFGGVFGKELRGVVVDEAAMVNGITNIYDYLQRRKDDELRKAIEQGNMPVVYGVTPKYKPNSAALCDSPRPNINTDMRCQLPKGHKEDYHANGTGLNEYVWL